jgi:hypothetical protein
MLKAFEAVRITFLQIANRGDTLFVSKLVSSSKLPRIPLCFAIFAVLAG